MSVNQFFSLISRIMQKDYSEIAYFTFTYFPQKVHSSETILEGNSPQSQQTARALVQWLCDETRKLKVVRSNPSTVYWMGIFALICCQNFIDVCLKMTKNKRKRGRGWTIFLKKTPQSLFRIMAMMYSQFSTSSTLLQVGRHRAFQCQQIKNKFELFILVNIFSWK